MANEEQLALLRRDVAAWNQWRQEHPEIQPDLYGANLSKENLHRANLSNTNLSHASLFGIDLTAANLSHANLSKADLSEADLSDADLSSANLSEADLSMADLSDVNLSRATLSEADLSDADLCDANLNEANLSGTNLFSADFFNADLQNANLQRANLSEANLSNANLNRADLNRANLSRAILVGTNLIEATLTNCVVYGISAWDIQLDGAEQSNLVITTLGSNAPTITVDDLEVAQFIYLLLNHKKLHNVLNAVTERGVLLLGRFSGGGLGVLQAVAARLREEHYLPIIFDFDRPQDRNYTETVKTLAGLSRFIIADLSGPSVPQELYATIPHFKIPFVPILEAGRKQFAMAVDLLEYPWVIRPSVVFTSTEELVSLIPSKIIAPAEEKHQARQQLLNELFHDG